MNAIYYCFARIEGKTSESLSLGSSHFSVWSKYENYKYVVNTIIVHGNKKIRPTQ